MRIGITCNVQTGSAVSNEGPDDLEEEFDKPQTVESIASVLREFGHEVEVLGDGPSMIHHLLRDPPDFVFNFAEGIGSGRSREARVPAVLEMLGIPYSGSDPLTLAATLDKDCAKRLVQSVGIATPRWLLVDRNTRSTACAQVISEVGFPAIVKPAYEGSSKGIRSKCLVDSVTELELILDEVMTAYRQPVLVEEYVRGEEVTVGVVGNEPARVLGVMAIRPTSPTDRFVYSLEVKRDWQRRVEYETPAPLDADVRVRVERATLDAYRVLGCLDVSRLDFRIRDRVPYLLEVNPLPGLNPDSGDLVLLARGYGVTHTALVELIFSAACTRQGLETHARRCHSLA